MSNNRKQQYISNKVSENLKLVAATACLQLAHGSRCVRRHFPRAPGPTTSFSKMVMVGARCLTTDGALGFDQDSQGTVVRPEQDAERVSSRFRCSTSRRAVLTAP